MPNPLATSGGTAQATRPARANGAVVPVVPFIRASAEHREPVFDQTKALVTTGSQQLGVFDVPAYGYIRAIVLVVTATGATGGTLFEDGPWSVLQNVALTEPNGAVIAQFDSGYSLFLANKWGGYRSAIGADPRSTPAYSQDAVGNFTFLVRIPVEISAREGLGALPNQNSAAQFKVKVDLATGAAAATGPLYTAITLQPTVRVRAYLEAWDQPETSVAGQTNQLTPPAMNTTQFWSAQTYNVGAGQQQIRLTRVGNYLRNLVMILRRAGTSRANGDTDMPDPTTIYLDTRPLDVIERNNWKNQMFDRTGLGGRAAGGALTAALALDTAGGLDAGVFVYDFAHEFDASLGRETRDLWLPTLGSSRLEVQGTFANAGTLTVLTNDVAVAGSVFI
jgi:hypothetical protein